MICLPMAGLSSRFFKAGYTAPKYMLDLKGQTVFAHALRSFEAYFTQQPMLIICRADFDTPTFVRAECEKAGLPADRLDLVVLEHETAGQAETVAKGLEAAGVDPAQALTIFNIDTFRPGFRYPTAFDPARVDGYLEVFEGEGDHWSFAAPDESAAGAFQGGACHREGADFQPLLDGALSFPAGRPVPGSLCGHRGTGPCDPAGRRKIHRAALQHRDPGRKGHQIRPDPDRGGPLLRHPRRIRGPAGVMAEADPLARLRQVAGRLETGDAALDAYREAAEVLTTALPHLREISAGEDAAQAGLYRSLITQPAPGMHQLAHQVSHLATAGTPDMAEQLMHPLGPTLAGLIDRLEDLSPRAQARTVLFAVTTRAFSRDVVPPQTVSRLHSSHFSSFDPADLGLPYSVMFSPRVFGRNKDEPDRNFLPRGHLERLDGSASGSCPAAGLAVRGGYFRRPGRACRGGGTDRHVRPAAGGGAAQLAMRFGDSAFRAGVGLPSPPLPCCRIVPAPPRRWSGSRENLIRL